MLNDLKEGLFKFEQVKGLRNVLWLLLVAGIAILAVESVTQYFATSTLQRRAELLIALSKVNSGVAHQKKVAELHGELIEGADKIFRDAKNPGSYLLERFLRFIKGAYLSLPLFYLSFKLLAFGIKNLKENPQRLTMLLSSIALSATAWFATILGGISVIWNSSDSLFVSWTIFPVISFLIFLPFAVWLALLRIVMPDSKRESGENRKSGDTPRI